MLLRISPPIKSSSCRIIKTSYLAAESAAQLTVKHVTVVPSRSVPQGMAGHDAPDTPTGDNDESSLIWVRP